MLKPYWKVLPIIFIYFHLFYLFAHPIIIQLINCRSFDFDYFFYARNNAIIQTQLIAKYFLRCRSNIIKS